MEIVSTIQPFFPRLGGWGDTQSDTFETSQRNQTLPFCSWPQGYKLVGQVQFMLLVIQKGG